LSALLAAAVSRVIETIGVRAPTDNGLTCGVDRLIGGENDFTGGETARMDHENRVTGGENDLTNGENGRAAAETPLHFDVVILVQDLNLE